MTKDYAAKKHQGTPKTRPHSHSWLWWLTGLLMGVFLTSFLFIKVQPNHNSLKTDLMQKLSSGTSERVAAPTKAVTTNLVKKPKFDFYTILPEMEVVVPTPHNKTNNAHDNSVNTPSKPLISGEVNATYILQLASYKNYSDAEEFKAKLALLGFETNIETVSLNGDNWHRVRLGPYKQISQVESVRSNLQAQNINSLMLKLKG